MRLKTCRHCAIHFLAIDEICPNCAFVAPNAQRNSVALVTALLGLCLTGCGDKSIETGLAGEDSGQEDSAIDTGETNIEPPYGVGDMDQDGDGWENGDDCDDSDDSIYPGAAYHDSSSDCMKDSDGDGYGDNATEGGFIAGTDCDDSDEFIHPAATEIAGDGIDQNCDGEDP